MQTYARHAATILLFLLLALAGGNARSQGLSIDIVDGHASAVPITVVPFAFEGAGLPPDTDVAASHGKLIDAWAEGLKSGPTASTSIAARLSPLLSTSGTK